MIAENLPTLTGVRGEEVVKNGGLKKPMTSLPSVVRVLIVNHASDASGNCADCSTFGTAQKTSDCCSSAAAARDDQR